MKLTVLTSVAAGACLALASSAAAETVVAGAVDRAGSREKLKAARR